VIVVARTRKTWQRAGLQDKLNWQADVSYRYRKRRRTRKNWMATKAQDLEDMVIACQDVEHLVEDRPMWRSCVARHVEVLSYNVE